MENMHEQMEISAMMLTIKRSSENARNEKNRRAKKCL